MAPNKEVLHSLERTVALITQLIANMEAAAFRQEGFSELSMRQVFYIETTARLGYPSFAELAEELGVSRPSVTGLVGKLIKRGYMRKVQDGDDRRSFHIVLTPKGMQFTHLHEKFHRRVVQALIHRLDEAEVNQLDQLLAKSTAK